MDRRNLKHLNMLRDVARQLADKRDIVVFVGGAVTGLFFTDPAAAEVRPTADVDLVADVLTYTEYIQLEAFLDRGKGDFLASHDLEDVIAVIDGRAEIFDDIASSDTDVKDFVSRLIRDFLNNKYFLEALPGKLEGDFASQARLPIIVERLKAIAEL
jgi:hypothetical protein